MIVSIINRSPLPDAEVQRVIRAVNRQITDDFEPYWSFGGRLRLEGPVGKRRDRRSLPEMRGDAVLYLLDARATGDALGWHESHYRDIPVGFVPLDLATALDESWTTTFSHEALELIGDPLTNLLVQGPHPRDRRRLVFHMFEMCDAVQSESYLVDGVAVSNFVLPSYFTRGEQEGRRNDFLGTRRNDGTTLPSFGVNPGGYINYYDPRSQRWIDTPIAGDTVAARRRLLKRRFKLGRSYRRTHAAPR